jgi:RNA polymerase sigma-70 factor, ECF subfamily
MAFLVMLESLSPVERAVLLLSEVFDYEMDEIAQMVGKSPANCRQILHRAREATAQRKHRYMVAVPEAQKVMERFGEAAAGGDLQGLLAMLDPEIILFADGGGKARSALAPVRGSSNVAKFFAGIARKGALDGITRVYAEVNRQPAIAASRDGVLLNVLVFDLKDGRIRTLYSVSNPDKLKSLSEAHVGLR